MTRLSFMKLIATACLVAQGASSLVTLLNVLRRVMRASAAVMAFGALLAPCAQAQLTISPANPAAGSMIRIEGVSGCFGNPMEISVEGMPHRPGSAVIKVFDPGYFDPPLMTCPAANKNHVMYGPVSAGSYRLEHYRKWAPPTADQLLGVSTFTVTAGSNTQAPAGWFGNWWAPTESGWAVNVERDPASGHIFMAWYTHEQEGSVIRPVWIVAPNLTQTPFLSTSNRLTGELYRAQGNRSLLLPVGSPVPPPFTIAAQPIGTVTLEFTAVDRMTLRYTMLLSGGRIAPSGPNLLLESGALLLQKFTY